MSGRLEVKIPVLKSQIHVDLYYMECVYTEESLDTL